MNELEKLARNAVMLSGRAPSLKGKPKDKYEQGHRFPYLAKETHIFAQQVGEIASNCFEAECQGFYDDDFYKWKTVLVRPIPASNARTGEIMPDEWQEIDVVKPSSMDTVKPGAYFKFADNTWIAYKGHNIGSVDGTGILRRCNFVINKLDYYGNVVHIPASFSKMGTLANAPRATENSIIAKNYMACIMQRNSLTKDFAENTRFILGDAAYAMRGLNDFTREFTDDEYSIHLTTFTIERAEPTDQDNMELAVADYHAFSWKLRVNALSDMRVGESQKLEVTSVRNGETVSGTSDYPIEYIFRSSDTSVLTVDEVGTVHAANKGVASIEVSLAQNPTVKHTVSIKTAESGGTFVSFTSSHIAKLKEYESCSVRAILYENGKATDKPIKFSFSGPSEICYTAVSTGANDLEITCYAASKLPLRIRAENGQYSAETEIRLTSG